jgi:hypothetical protein
LAPAAAGVAAAAALLAGAVEAADEEAPVLGGGALPHPVTPTTIPDTAAAIRLSVNLMMFVPFYRGYVGARRLGFLLPRFPHSPEQANTTVGGK